MPENVLFFLVHDFSISFLVYIGNLASFALGLRKPVMIIVVGSNSSWRFTSPKFQIIQTNL